MSAAMMDCAPGRLSTITVNRPVVHDHGLAQDFRQPGREHAHDDVVPAAGGVADDDADRLGRKLLRGIALSNCRRTGDDQRQCNWRLPWRMADGGWRMEEVHSLFTTGHRSQITGVRAA
jgi:hypothetical protein